MLRMPAITERAPKIHAPPSTPTRQKANFDHDNRQQHPLHGPQLDVKKIVAAMRAPAATRETHSNDFQLHASRKEVSDLRHQRLSS